MATYVPSMAPGKIGFDAAADLVVLAMADRELTVSGLADLSGVSRVNLSNWINGRRPLRADYLIALLPHLGISLVHAPRQSRPSAGGSSKARRRA